MYLYFPEENLTLYSIMHSAATHKNNPYGYSWQLGQSTAQFCVKWYLMKPVALSVIRPVPFVPSGTQ